MTFEFTNKFKKDLKKLKKQGKDLKKLYQVIGMLLLNAELDERYKAHSLIGNWQGFSELHIEPDWLLIYQVTDDGLYLARSGSHSELFS